MMIFLDPHKFSFKHTFSAIWQVLTRMQGHTTPLGRTNYTVPVTTHSAREVLKPNQKLKQLPELGKDKFQVMKHSPRLK